MNTKNVAILILVHAVVACASIEEDSVPGHLDPHHHIRFQNGYVRVMETHLEPGEETGAHSHPIEAAVVFLTDGEFEITSDDGSVEVSTATRNTVAFGDSAIVHRTRNVGEATARTVTVEVFSRPPPVEGEGFDFELGEPLLDNEKLRMSRVRLAPGAAAELCGASPSVLIALAPTVLRPGSGAAAEELGVGDVLWCAPGGGAVQVDASRSLDAILVALKPRTRSE